MAAGPAVTAIILTAISFALIPRIIIGGTAYEQLMWGKDFQTGTASPSLYIIEIHSEVQQLTVQAAADKPISGLQSDIARRQAQYERDYDSWVARLTDPQARQDITASHEAAEEYFRLYEQKLLPAVRANKDADAANLLETQMSRALGEHHAAAQSAAHRVDNQVRAQEAAVRSQAGRQTLGIIAVTLLIIGASTALGLTVLRSITERVKRLTEVATIELPQVLDEVKRAALAGEEIPSLPAPRGEGGDELAAAAVAFNSVVATAVDLAAEQSRVRRSTSQMFINLGRRNHKLLSRTLTYITQLESDERDPATLQNLFRLDHLTTRMRRHAESLLVLAGSPPLRTWSRPVPVADVLRAALSEIETYDRVDIKELEPVEVRGASVSDLAHLLAELLENATAFSPPQTRVRVLGRIDSDGYTVVVVDEGIGMSPQELEAANASINTTDGAGFVGDSRMLGLGVVGRLAARHGFKVNLTASPVGGVVAWVTLPTSALAPRRGAAESDPVGGLAAAGLLNAPDNLPRQPTTDDEDAPATDDATPPVANGKTGPGGLASTALPLRPAGAAPASTNASAPSGPVAATPDVAPSGDSPEGSATPVPVTAAATGATTQGGPAADADTTPADEASAGAAAAGTADVARGTTDAPEAPARATADEGSAVTGAISLPPRAPEVASPATGSVIIPPAPEVSPVSGPIAFRKPQPGPGEPGTLTRRVRGAQLPDTGEAPPGSAPASSPARPERSAQSVRGALQSFNAGRRTASEVTLANSHPGTGPISTGGPAATAQRPAVAGDKATADKTADRATADTAAADGAAPAKAQPAARSAKPAARPAQPAERPAARSSEPSTASGGSATSGGSPARLKPATAAEPVIVPGGPQLPRRVRGAQMPETDLPSSEPAPERSAAEVRAALSNFVAGRRAAEHDD
jgi:signal transduction histidine kinase